METCPRGASLLFVTFFVIIGNTLPTKTPKMLCLCSMTCQNTSETIDYIHRHPQWHLSLQTHKYPNIR